MPEPAPAPRDRRAPLRARLVDIAEARIAAEGLSALRARDLAREAGCALGAIYTVFDDLNELALAVNARTFARLGAAVAARLTEMPSDPARQLVVLGQTYHAFAAANRQAWAAVFAVERSAGQATAGWYLTEMDRLFDWIEAPLARLYPDLPPGDLALLARALFSAVHGIVSLGLSGAAGGVPATEIDRMIAMILAPQGGARPVPPGG